MMSLESLRELYRHLEWADSMVWRAVSGLSPDVHDEYLHNTLHHLHGTQWSFMEFWAGRAISPHDATKFESLAAIQEWARPFHEEVSTFLTSLEPVDLDREAVVPWARYIIRRLGRQPDATRLGETIFQVAMHSAYHRGQVNRRLRELGAEPPLVDYIVWVWLGRPAAIWQDE